MTLAGVGAANKREANRHIGPNTESVVGVEMQRFQNGFPIKTAMNESISWDTKYTGRLPLLGS